jgi:SAM-dependent methyltransferase
MADEQKTGNERWSEYYRKVRGRPINAIFGQALMRFERPGFAIDLGCGAGVETLHLLQRGWQVLAIDKQEAAVDHVHDGAEPEQRERLETRVAPFEGLTLPPADFIWAGLSLPFCSPDHFDDLWSGIVAALRPGGRFAGDLFGVRHAWVDNGGTFHTREQVEALASPLHLEYIQEGEGEVPTALDGFQAWHQYSLIARKD